MKLRYKVLILYFCVIFLVLFCIGVLLPSSLNEKNLGRFQTDITNQLKHIDFALTYFFDDVENDIRQLLADKDVRYPDDTGFTSFLNASPDTFQYAIGSREQAIIDELYSFLLHHPAVNSVYMGRESGAFVRSHPRSSPTTYDPRTRPWYILGKENPGQVMRTDPYPSVTTPDLNIGVVSALIDQNGGVYGVLGADITLEFLTDYITDFNFGRDVQILLVNETGTVLAAKDKTLLFRPVSLITGDKTGIILDTSEGMLTFPHEYLVYYTSPQLGWKYLVFIPFSDIEREMFESIMTILLFVILALILLSVITLLVLDQTVIMPIISLTTIAHNISKTGDLNQVIAPDVPGEIGDLTRSLSMMIETIKVKEQANIKANEELSQYRDHLNNLVRLRTNELEIVNEELKNRGILLEQVNEELKAAKERAEDTDRLKSAFLATMSHELRTPLNSIIGFTGIILQGLAGPLNGEQNKQLGLVQQSARHLLALINDVLYISKIEAGELNISCEPVEINPSILSVVKTMQPIAAQKGLHIDSSLSPDAGYIIGDQRRIEQVFMNLLSNAVKFTENGSITVRSYVDTGNVIISVEDSGIGIAAEDLLTLFTPFHQIDSGTTRKHEGTGLGLSISKKLIELHGGRITVTSVPGQGSVFTVSLPVSNGLNG